MKTFAWIACLLGVAAGCGTDEPSLDEALTGPLTRYAVTGLAFPMNNAENRITGFDFTGDDLIDNTASSAVVALAGFNDITTHGRDMIAAGAIASSVILQADDLGNDASVGVTYLGEPGAAAVAMRGSLSDGALVTSDPSRAGAPGRAIVALPVFRDADPVVAPILHPAMSLQPDDRGGLSGVLAGCLESSALTEALVAPLFQSIDADPRDHLALARLVDSDDDGVLEPADLRSGVVATLTEPDVELDGSRCLTIGIRIELTPCESGSCSPPVADACFDRVLDGDETDVDCGGSCGACGGGRSCAVTEDCQSSACDDGRCGVASCRDGVANGLESDVDCGFGCAACARGRTCVQGLDCASGMCGPGQVCT